MNLSDEQTKVVESKDDHILVLAGAGCGKTTTLVEFARRNSGTDGGRQAVVLTFSNKAANDVREKLEASVPDYRDRMFVGTIHEFCLDMIRRFGNTVGLDPNTQVFESDDDRLEVFMEALRSMPGRWDSYMGFDEADRKRRFREMFIQMSLWKRSFGEEGGVDAMLYREYDGIMASMGAMDFDDILVYAHRILMEQPSVAELYRMHYGLVCVDEAQDLDNAQYAVIRALADGTMRTFMVGDPKQAIYGFSGASAKYMCESYPRDFQVTTYKLRDNYRSSREVIAAAQMIERNFEPEGKVPIRGEFRIDEYAGEREEAAAVADRIEALLAEGHPDVPAVAPGSICVMARNRYVLRHVQEELESRGVEHTLRSGSTGPVFGSDFFRALWLGLKVILNPRDSFHRERLDRILGTSGADPADSSTFDDDSPRARCLAEVWGILRSNEARGVFDTSPAEGVMEEFISSAGDADLVSDMEEWDAIRDQYLRASSAGSRSLAGLLSSSSLWNVRAEAVRGVVLSTVHMAKGLEYDVVFIVGVNEGVFPDRRSKTPEALEEERHNMFVSITRAKRLCYLSYVRAREGRDGMRAAEPSRYVAMLRGDGPAEE